MLVIQDTKRFKEAKDFARKTGLASQFAKQLNYLRTYAESPEGGRPKVRVTLGWDFAPHSFSILWERWEKDSSGATRPGWRRWFNGGLIFHGPHDRGGDGGAPTFSVNLSPHVGWSVHT